MRSQRQHKGLVAAGTGNPQVYKCKIGGCDAFHIGHLPGKGQIRFP